MLLVDLSKLPRVDIRDCGFGPTSATAHLAVVAIAIGCAEGLAGIAAADFSRRTAGVVVATGAAVGGLAGAARCQRGVCNQYDQVLGLQHCTLRKWDLESIPDLSADAMTVNLRTLIAKSALRSTLRLAKAVSDRLH